MELKFVYYWEEEGMYHTTFDEKEAEKALQAGSTVLLKIVDKYRKDGTERAAE